MILLVSKDGIAPFKLYIAGVVNAKRQAQSYRKRGYNVITTTRFS